VSSDLQAERGTIEAQRDYLQNQAARDGYAPVIEEWDAGWSGTIPFHERPGGRRITDAAEAGRLDVLYVYAWDRRGRDAAERIAVARYLESLGVEVVSATQGRPDTAAGRFQRNIHLVVAEYGRENILEVTRSGKLRAARQGKWCGRVPYGWTVKDGILVHCQVEVLPGMTEADVMRGILVRLADTATSLSQRHGV
jgi:DNA invertase Pin-like site-specific DNA recombinase